MVTSAIQEANTPTEAELKGWVRRGCRLVGLAGWAASVLGIGIGIIRMVLGVSTESPSELLYGGLVLYGALYVLYVRVPRLLW